MSDQITGLDSRKLILIDAYSLLFRAFFASRPLTTRDGRPTGALYGFANMLFTILRSERPDAIVVCWDGPEQTNRSKQYEAYKAHRPEVHADLKSQFPIARDLVAAFGIQSAELPGYEADDLIGTLATRGVHCDYEVSIVTGDSDQLQLVGGGVQVLMTQHGVSEMKIYDPDAVRQRYGIEPTRIPDWKALVGDTSDNIPGVPGIGEKTATALLQKWDSLENLLNHLDEVTPPRAKTALENNIDQARFSLELATIVCDSPLDLEIKPFAPGDEDHDRLRALFLDLEFKSLISRIPKSKAELETSLGLNLSEEPEVAFSAELTELKTPAELEAAIQEAKSSGNISLLLDTKGSAPMLAELKGIAFAVKPDRAYYASLRLENENGSSGDGLFEEELDPNDGLFPLSALLPLLTDPEIRRAGHNAKFVEVVLARLGIHIPAFQFDTMVAAYLINSGRSAYPIIDLAESYLHIEKGSLAAAAAPIDRARDAAIVLGLSEPMQAELTRTGMTEVFEKIELPLIPVLADIEQQGLLIDVSYLRALASRMGTQLDADAKQVYELAGEEFNIGSTKQLQAILFDKLQLPTGKKIKTGFSTGADILEALAPKYEIAQKILDYREISKLKTTYADALSKLIHPKTGRIHTSLNQTVASTGRLSSSDPNLQNIPVRSESGRQIRRAFIAPPGKVLLSCDYSQIELRLLAHVTDDPTLVDAFTKDEDIHAATAAIVFNVPLDQVTPDMRRQAKTINFAVIYGQSGFSLATILGVDTSTANQWIKDYFARLQGVDRYIQETIAVAHLQKYVTTLMGRRRYLPEIDSTNRNLRQFAERAAVNMPIQGTAADIMKLAMILVQKYVSEKQSHCCSLLLQVHDELLFEIEEKELNSVAEGVLDLMENAYPLKIRLRVDAKAGSNWAEMSPLKL